MRTNLVHQTGVRLTRTLDNELWEKGKGAGPYTTGLREKPAAIGEGLRALTGLQARRRAPPRRRLH